MKVQPLKDQYILISKEHLTPTKTNKIESVVSVKKIYLQKKD